MTNSEIRQKALSKVKVKNLTFFAVLSGVLIWLHRFSQGVMESRLADAALGAGAAFLLSLLFPAGLVRVSMNAWRKGAAPFSDFFAYFYRPKLLLRGLALGLFAAAFRFLFLLLPIRELLARSYQGLLVACLAAALLLPFLFGWIFLYFALELQPEVGLFRALSRGSTVTLQNIGRILQMELSLLWWVALVWLAALFISVFSGLGGAALDVVTSLVALTLAWLIGAYVCLANAGLAREIMKD